MPLLSEAMGQRNSMMTFYIVIISSAIGIAFSDGYRKLTVFPKLCITAVVGIAVWYNFWGAFISTLYIIELVHIIEESIPADDPLLRIFDSPMFNSAEKGIAYAPIFIFVPINFIIMFAMWWDEFLRFKEWLIKRQQR